jgi:hypothetical protein
MAQFSTTPWSGGLQKRIDLFNNAMQNFTRNAAAATSGQKFDIPLEARIIMLRVVNLDGSVGFLPDVFLPVNPDKFDVTHKKKSSLVYTMGGFVTQHWHDDIITIDASGFIPSFANQAKIISDSYHAFLKVVDIYMKCGQIEVANEKKAVLQSFTTKDDQLDSMQNDVSARTGGVKPSTTSITIEPRTLLNAQIQLIYQDIMYTGIFQTFTIQEDYEQPNTLRYRFTFHASDKADTMFGSLGKGFDLARQFGFASSNTASTLAKDSANRFISKG